MDKDPIFLGQGWAPQAQGPNVGPVFWHMWLQWLWDGPEQVRLAELMPTEQKSAQEASYLSDLGPKPIQTLPKHLNLVSEKSMFFTDSPFFGKPIPAEKLDWCCDRFEVSKARDGSKQLRLAELVPMKPESAREVP